MNLLMMFWTLVYLAHVNDPPPPGYRWEGGYLRKLPKGVPQLTPAQERKIFWEEIKRMWREGRPL